MKIIKSRKCRLCFGSKFVKFIPMFKGRRLPEKSCPKCNGTGVRE